MRLGFGAERKFGHDRSLFADLGVKIFVFLRINDINAGAEHGQGRAFLPQGIHSALVGGRIDAASHAGDNQDAVVG